MEYAASVWGSYYLNDIEKYNTKLPTGLRMITASLVASVSAMFTWLLLHLRCRISKLQTF